MSGCTDNQDPYDSKNFIDYSKPRFKWFHKDDPIITGVNVTNTSSEPKAWENPIPVDRDYMFGSYNIQKFGKTKAETKEVYSTIINIIDDYDIIAIQEVTDVSGYVIDKLSSQPAMRVVASERLGRSYNNKEQYLFVYSGRVIPGTSLQYPDPQDKFEREPFMMSFNIDGLSIVIINVHIKPDDAEQELLAMEDVITFARTEYQNDNIFIMGDLNADCKYFDSFGETLGTYYWIIPDFADTTVAETTNCAYDRIILISPNENVNAFGVDRLETEVDENNKELLDAVSDHYPVYIMYKKQPLPEVVE